MSTSNNRESKGDEASLAVDPLKDMAQAFKDLAKGEETATAMENKLSLLEQKIDSLLASVDGGDVAAIDTGSVRGGGEKANGAEKTKDVEPGS